MVICRKIYDSDYFNLISIILNNIGNIFAKQGQQKEALENYEKSLVIYRKVFGKDEASIMNIGNILLEQQKYNEALENFKSSLTIYRNVYMTDDHPKISDILAKISILASLISDID